MSEVPGEREESSGTADPALTETLRAFADLSYRDRFWPHRRYEDLADRIALRAFLPATGGRLLDVGAGFGRLCNEYLGYLEVVLLDPSDALLGAAREWLGSDPRFTMVNGDAYQLPFPDASFDAVVCVRVIHHIEHPQPAIREFARVLRPGGVLVLESANKRNLKAVLAYALRRRRRSPFARGSEPYEGVRLVPDAIRRIRGVGRSSRRPPGDEWSATTAFVHAPGDLRTWLRTAGFDVEATRSVGFFRPPAITGSLPVGLLVRLERLQQVGLARVTAGPSLFFRAVRRDDRWVLAGG